MAHNKRQGMLMALAGFGCLTIGDSIIKSIAGEWPGTAVAALRYCFAATGLGVLLLCLEGKAAFVLKLPKMQIMRGFAVGIATLAFFSSLFLMPLAEATAIQFTNPMITALLSAWLLKEKAGKVAWIATIVAFVGVLIVLRPNFIVLGWAAILPIIAAFGLAFLMIGNRQVAGTGSALQMQFWVALFAVPVLLLAASAGHFSGVDALKISVPDWSIIVRCGAVAITASFAHWLIYLGTTRASAAEIAPTVYIQIIVALFIGIVYFGEWPGALSLFGAAIIVGAGLFLWNHRNP